MDANAIAVTGIVVAAVVAIAVEIFTVWATRRFGSHRGRLQIVVRNVEIVGKARFIVDGTPINPEPDPEPDPLPAYVIQLRLRNRGIHDIPVDAFEGKRLVLSLGGAGVLATGSVQFNVQPFVRPPGQRSSKAEIDPVRIPRRAAWGCVVFSRGEEPTSLFTRHSRTLM